VFQAWHELVTTLAQIAIAPDRFAPSQTPVASQVASEAAIWEAYRPAIARYQQQVSLDAPAWEFLKLLGDADKRRDYCAFLLTRFGIDAQQGIYHNYDALSPSDKPKALSALLDYWNQQAIVHSCLRAVGTAQQAGHDLQRTLQAAVLAMREAVFDGIAQQSIWLHTVANSARPEVTTRMLAGWVRPQIRMYPSVRSALGAEGEPRTILCERLPAYVLEAHREGARETGELLESVRRLINQSRRTQRKRSPNNAPEPILERLEARRTSKQHAPSELEEWHIRQEVSQQLDALIQCTPLSPREVEFLSLSRSGLSYSAIASQKGIKVGTVKKVMFRAKERLSKTAHS
jgi:DNA-binding CsgD family transcriptional regulator